MILGRSLTLWTGAVAAILNALVLVNVVTLNGDQIAGMNAAVFGVLALLASNDSLAAAKGAAAAARIASGTTAP